MDLFKFALSSVLEVAAAQQHTDPKIKKVVTSMALSSIALDLKEMAQESQKTTTSTTTTK